MSSASEEPTGEAEPCTIEFYSMIPIRHSWFPIYHHTSHITQKEAIVRRITDLHLRSAREWKLSDGDVNTDSFLETPFITCALDLSLFQNDFGHTSSDPRPSEALYVLSDHGYAYVSLRFDVHGTTLESFSQYQSFIDDVHTRWVETSHSVLPSRLYEWIECVDHSLVPVFTRENVKVAAKSHLMASSPSLCRSYCDSVVLSSAIPQLVIDRFIGGFGGGAVRRGDFYFRDVAWSVGYGSNVYVVASDEGRNLCLQITGRSVMAWAMYDDIVQEMKSALKLNLASREGRSAESIYTLKYLRRYSELISIVTTPGEAANWETSINLYSDIWTTWRLDSLHSIATDGSEEITRMLREEAEIAGTKAAARVNFAAQVITIIVFLGLSAQLVEYFHSDPPPSYLARVIYLLASGVVLLIIIVWVLATRRRPPD